MTLEPAHALGVIENALRIAIRERLPTWQTALGEEAVQRLQEKADEEDKRRDGTVASKDLLDYTETYQLTTLILKHWNSGDFKPVFDDKPRTTVWFGVVSDYRNAVAHGRQLLDYERDLLSGVAGQVRNQVALYRSSATSQARYYPLIEHAEDSFGRAAERGLAVGPQGGLRLDVGDTLSIRASAVPSTRNFDLRWTLDVKPFSDPALGVSEGEVVVVGPEVEIQYVVRPEDVREGTFVRLVLASKSQYHRHHEGYDDAVWWPIVVNPPEDE